MERKWTPEPWTCYPISDRVMNNHRGYSITGPETETTVRDVLPDEVEGNAARIVACINAMKDVPDPSAFMESYREMRTALEKLSCLGNGDRPGNSDGNRIAQAALANADKLEGAGK